MSLVILLNGGGLTNMFSSVRELIEHAAAKNGEKIFLYCDEKEVSFKEIDRTAGKVANFFKSLGIEKGDKVSLYLPNRIEFFYCWFGLAKLGAVMVPINTYFKEAETTYVINHSDSKVVVTDSSAIEMILKIDNDCPALEHIVSVEKHDNENVVDFHSRVNEQESDVEPVQLQVNDDAAILYTSGTTGHPKGCLQPQSYYLVNPRLWAEALELNENDRVLNPLPLFHMNPQILSTMGALLLGASVIILDRFHPRSWWDDVIKYEATQFHYLGVMPAILSSFPPSPKDQAHKVRVTLGAGISHDYHAEYEKRFNLKAIEVFGMTEMGLCMTAPLHGDRKLGTGCVGKPLEGFRAKVVDDQDNEVAVGESGELVIQEDARPDGSAVMKGYYKDEKATEEAWRGGWFHTGDIVRKDEDGFYYFVDRKKDIIRRSGENISSMEVEDCVRSHPKVAEAAVVPVPDEIREEEVRVVIVLKEGESAETVPEQSIIDWCEERLAYFKVPRYVEYVDDFPRTASQKIRKAELKENLPERCYDKVAQGYVSLKA